MARTVDRRLKVFQAQFGFHDSVVAAPSQAAALRAWGVHQNLFADGQAHATDDPQAVEAALAQPGTPLRRAVGSHDAFALEPSRLPDVPDAPRKKAPAPAPKSAAPKRPPADRSALNAAEAALGKVDDARKKEEADLRKRRDELEAREQAAQADYVERRKAAAATVVEARRRYRDAGGED